SCASCHTDASAHPTRWQGSNDITPNYLTSHRNAGQQSTNCAVCHDVTQGSTAPNPNAPSCFTATFTNGDGSTTGCHANGPGAADHVLPFDTADLHGNTAKADLTACQACHGTPGTTSFAGGTADTSCASCHTDASAHPTRWQGSNDITPNYLTSHRNAGQQSTNCAVCHDVT
ncbi:MAG: hypothetical protein GY697_13770, partial [Desulfobacterales bacterium]|nr:hypothetical protein [Desulfobacterales bacterium]